MYMLLVLAVVLVIFSHPAAATGSIMDQTLPSAPMEPFFSDVESILDDICQYCAMPFYQCMHAVVRQTACVEDLR
jgi:hypothetical protein